VQDAPDAPTIAENGAGPHMDSLAQRDRSVVFKGRALRVATVKGEWYVDVDDPTRIIQQLTTLRPIPDIFSFWQRLPRTEPNHPYFMEWDNVTAVPVSSYDDWLRNRADKRPLKKSKAKGIEVRVVPFGDELLKAISEIFNEAPIRQGKPMRHYGKTASALRSEYLPEAKRTRFLGAFLGHHMVGFLMLVHAGSYLNIAQIMSKMEHWDKSPNNALIAKAVEICAEEKIPYLVYTKFYRHQGVTEFKRRNGFERINLPRYFIPITFKGSLALHLRLHRGIKGLLPERLVGWLLTLRSTWYSFKYGSKGVLRS
jgi:hypothetical protein